MSDAPQWAHLIIQVCLGISLSACAGLRAFLPLLVLGILARAGYVQVGPGFAWIGSDPSLVIFGAATVVEILADKIPAVDHFLDSGGLFIKPVAGTILFSTVIIRMDPLLAVVLGLIVGGSLSELIHIKKAGLRVASSGMTGGAGNPFLSIAEDAGASAGVALSFIAPVLAAFVVLFGIYAAFKIYRKVIDTRSRRELEMGRRKMETVMQGDMPVEQAGEVQ